MSHEASDRRWRLCCQAMMGPGPAYDSWDARDMRTAHTLLDAGWIPMPWDGGEHWLRREATVIGRGPRVWRHMADLLAGRVPRLRPSYAHMMGLSGGGPPWVSISKPAQ